MERRNISVVRTPANRVAVQRRSKTRSYRLSYRSCLGAASQLGVTPALTARRLNTSRRAPKLHNANEKVNAEQLASLLKTEWRLSYVTPLYKFRHTQMRSYSRQLSAFIGAEQQQGLAMEVAGAQGNFRVSFSVVEGMTENDSDPETILIQIQSKPYFARHDEPPRMVWSGWLTCINGNSDYVLSLPKDYTCLPLFCSSGSDVFTSLVKSWFQQTFDCCFGPLEISDTSLQWLVALWTSCHAEYNIQHLTMIWTLPVEPPLQITYKVDPQDAFDLWNSIKRDLKETGEGEDREGSGSIDVAEVLRFMQGLRGHFYRHFGLDLSAGCLRQVSTALGSAKCNSRIKISDSRYMNATLTLLTECALLKMPI